MNIRFVSVLFLTVTFSLSGCGYNRETVLPNNIKTIYVETVKNKIPIQEVYVYVPGLEINITNAVIQRLQQDGTLKIVEREEADAVLQMHLIEFEQEGLRFDSLESIEEYRLFVVLDLTLIDGNTGDEIWREQNFSGQSEYFVSEIRSINRQEAADRAVQDLARNVVDRIVEDW